MKLVYIAGWEIGRCINLYKKEWIHGNHTGFEKLQP